MYNDPFNTYYLADDGRVYASARQLVVNNSDADFIAWSSGGLIPAMWPRDADGEQTEAALQRAIDGLRQFVNLAFYTANARQTKMQGDIFVNGIRFSTDPLTFGSLNSAYIYTQSNTGAVFSWKLPDGGFITLNKADTDALHAASNAFAQECFACEDATLDGIEAGSITTREQVDAAFAAVSNSFTGLRDVSELKPRHGARVAKK